MIFNRFIFQQRIKKSVFFDVFRPIFLKFRPFFKRFIDAKLALFGAYFCA